MLMVNQLCGFGVSGARIANPSYANPGGTGDRQASIVETSGLTIDFGTINLLIEGVTTDSSGIAYAGGQAVTSAVVFKFDFGAGASKVINEIKIYRHGGGAGGIIGDVKAQGSNNDADWTDVGTSITLGGTYDMTDSTLSANTTGYRYYRYLGLSGTTASSGRTVIDEVEFKIDDF